MLMVGTVSMLIFETLIIIMLDTRVWIYNWQDDRFFACLEQPAQQSQSTVLASPLFSGRQGQLLNFVGVVVGTVERIAILKSNIPRPVAVTLLSNEHQLSSPLVYTPTKLLDAPHALPKWRCATVHLSDNAHVLTPEPNSQELRHIQQTLCHVRRFLMNNEIRLGVHLTAYDTFELNACLLYSVRFPGARTKLPYGWVTVRCVRDESVTCEAYDVIQDTTDTAPSASGQDNCRQSLNTAEMPLLSCVSIDIEVAVSSKAGIFPHYSVNPILCVACIDGVLDPNTDEFLVSRRTIYTTLKCTCTDLNKCIDYGECLLKKPTSKQVAHDVPVTLRQYEDERLMLYECIKESIIPNLVVTGYNIARFDMPYMFCRYLVLRSMGPLISQSTNSHATNTAPTTTPEIRDTSKKQKTPSTKSWEPPELTREQYQMLDETYGNTYFRHQMPLYRWQKIAATIRLPYQVIVDVYSYVQQFSEAAFKNLVTKKLDDVCVFENIAGGKFGIPKPKTVATSTPLSSLQLPPTPEKLLASKPQKQQLSTLDIVRSLDPHLILPYCDRDTALPLVLLTEKKYFRFIVSLSILTGFSIEAVLETNISAIVSTFHNLYSVVVAKSITPYRFVYNGTSAVGTDYTFHLRHVLPERRYYGISSGRANDDYTVTDPRGVVLVGDNVRKRRHAESSNASAKASPLNQTRHGLPETTVAAGSDDKIDSDDVSEIDEEYEDVMKGGHVIEPIAGIYEGAVDSIDIESLYPSTEIALNMSPGTIFRLGSKEFDDLGGRERFQTRYNIYLADRVGFYLLTLRGPRGPFAQVQHHLLQLRRETKRSSSTHLKRDNPNMWSQLDAIQRVLKLMANGSYGTVSSKMFLATTNRSIGELTTQVARAVLVAVENEFSTVYGIPVIYGDTDSVMLHTSTVTCQQMIRHMECAEKATTPKGRPSRSPLLKNHDATSVPDGDSLAWLATRVVGRHFPDTIDDATGEPVVRFVFERRYALYAVCKKKMNAALLSPCRELRVTGLKSHAPAAVKAAVLRILKNILEYRVVNNARTDGTVCRFRPPSNKDLQWVAQQYLDEYQAHFVHNFANSRSINKVKSTLSRPPDYIRRITLVKGSKVTTDTVEHVRIWSDFNVTRLDQVLNLRTSDEFDTRYIIDIRPLFFEMDRKSLLRDTLVSTFTTPMPSSSQTSSINKDNIEAATDRAATVTSMTAAMWTNKVVEPSLQSENHAQPARQLFSFKCRVFNLTDNLTKLHCEKVLRVKFSATCKGPLPLLRYLGRLQGIAAALLPPSCRTEVTDWGPEVGLQLMLQDALTQMMIRSKRRATVAGSGSNLTQQQDAGAITSGVRSTSTKLATFPDCLAPKGRRHSIPKSGPLIPLANLELTNPLETLLRPRNYQGWEIGSHECDLISLLCLLTVLYYDPKARGVDRVGDMPVYSCDAKCNAVSSTPPRIFPPALTTFSQKLNTILRDLIDYTSCPHNTTIIRSSFGCAKLIGVKIVQMTASVHDM